MRKRIFSIFLAVAMIFCIIPLSAYADEHQHTFENKHGYDLSNLPEGYSIPCKIYESPCSSECGYSLYSWDVFGLSGQFVDKTGTSGLVVYQHYREWFEKIYGRNATAKPYQTGGGSAGTGGVGRRPSGYADDKGTPSISRAGLQAIALKPVFRYRMRSGYPLVKSGEFSGLTFDGTENANSSYSVQVSANRLDVKNTSDSSIAWGRFYVSYEYTFPDYGTVYFDTDNISWKLYGAAQNTDGEISDVKSWSNGFTYVNPNDKTYGYRSVEPTFYRFWKPFTVYDTSRNMLTAGRTGRAVFLI